MLADASLAKASHVARPHFDVVRDHPGRESGSHDSSEADAVKICMSLWVQRLTCGQWGAVKCSGAEE